MPAIDLERFHDGYRHDLHHALSEINGGRKRSHWMWYTFPQIVGLGSSPTAAAYAVRSRAEADAFLRDANLGTCLPTARRCTATQRFVADDARS
jgi:uncharacterized protein (DUF1810 family)